MADRSAPLRRGQWALGLLLLAAIAASGAAMAQDTAPQAATPEPPAADPFQSAAPTAAAASPPAAAVPAPAREPQAADPFATEAPAATTTMAPAASPTPQSTCCVAGIHAAPNAPTLEPVQPVVTAVPAPAETTPPQVAPAPTTVAAPASPPDTTSPAPAMPATPPDSAPAVTAAPVTTAPGTTAPPVTVAAPDERPAGAGSPAPQEAEPPAPLPPVAVDHPNLTDTATLESAGQTIKLFGIVGLAGDYADGLKGYIAASGDHILCQPHDPIEFVCQLENGTDIAMAALVNGAAQARADAPDTYVGQQAEAQAARRGLWASLPPPPVPVTHPTVRDTATLAGGDQSYVLDGLEGIGGGYATDMQGYIAGNGDSLLCQAQGDAGRYVCLLPDGTDVAKVALVNGAARVTGDAPDAYRAQQADAIAHKRGIWQTVSETQAQVLMAPPPNYVPMPDEPQDGLVYVGGAPTAVIDGGTVFFAFAAGLGWGYWDHGHHWRGAPDRYAGHLERFHHNGAGLRGYAGGHGGFTPVGARVERNGGPGGLHAGPAGAGFGGRPGREGVGRPGMPGQTRVAGAGAPFVHPTGPSGGAFGHPQSPGGHQPGFGGHQQPGFGGHQQPGFAGHQQPGLGGHQQPGFAGRQQPGFGGHQQPGFGGHQQPGLGGHQPAFGGGHQAGFGGGGGGHPVAMPHVAAPHAAPARSNCKKC